MECQFSIEKDEGQGHRTSKTSIAINVTIFVANNKKQTSSPEGVAVTVDARNWTDGRITCRHSAPTSFLVLHCRTILRRIAAYVGRDDYHAR